MIEHHLFPTRRYPAAIEAGEAAQARSLLSVTSPSSPVVAWGSVLLQGVLDRVLGAGRFRVGAAARPGLLEVGGWDLLVGVGPADGCGTR